MRGGDHLDRGADTPASGKLFRTVQLGKRPLGDKAQGFLRPRDLVVAGSEGSEQGPGAGPDFLHRQRC